MKKETWGKPSGSKQAIILCISLLLQCSISSLSLGDGGVFAEEDRFYRGAVYRGSVEERSQEAIIIFEDAKANGKAIENLILKISVAGDARRFGWVIPFPQEPKIEREDAILFSELYAFVEARQPRYYSGAEDVKSEAAADEKSADEPVEVISRKTVGSFDTAVVKENVEGALNQWLAKEGFRTIANADDVIGFYRRKGYVFACIKVSDIALSSGRIIELHPLRFTFGTGGCDGIYFPMKLTGLQTASFNVNLYVFYHSWLNDRVSEFGFEHRGLKLKYRDWDTKECKPNAGKLYSAPQTDPFLKDYSRLIPNVARLFQKLYPGHRFYLTNIQATDLRPNDVRNWVDDLWLFPYYTDGNFVPYDARPGGPASEAWQNMDFSRLKDGSIFSPTRILVGALFAALVIIAFLSGKRLGQKQKGR